jgi:gamma-glutamyltranspeptidase/glutathione hydrolase
LNIQQYVPNTMTKSAQQPARSLSRRQWNLACAATALLGVNQTEKSRAMTAQQSATQQTQIASGTRGVVATVHPIASQAAIAAFERGGNAIDAAAAASVMLSVVDGFNSGIGGGCLALVRTSSGKVHAIDGREKAPLTAKPEMFYRDGRPDPSLSQVGPLAAGVPGLLAALDRLVRTHGKIAWSDALNGAAEVAESGFELDDNYVSRLRSVSQHLKKFPESARILLDDQGQPWKSGHRLVQSDLARTFRKLASEGIQWFYRGEFAERTEKFMSATGGMLSGQDFADYQAIARQPVQSNLGTNRVHGFPPPSSGGIHIAQMLGMLSHFDVKSIFSRSETAGRHLLLEVMKRAMADRAYWLGDSDFAKVPKGLIDAGYLAKRAASINLEKSVAVKSHGQPPRADIDLFGSGGHTTHLTTADGEGNVVALTQTVNTTFGCKMIVPGTGVVLNNELDDFSIAPGVRNAFGLLGSEANLIAPGKRPLSSMSPTIVTGPSGAPILSCGAAGGPKIITTVLQVLVHCLLLDESIQDAIAAPRCHHQWSPDKAVCERANEATVIEGLDKMGHEVSLIGKAAVAQGLSLDGQGQLTAAADPRVPSSAMSL